MLDRTPFYPEGGGQVGDTGKLLFGNESIKVLDTRKENNAIIHYVDKLPSNIQLPINAFVDIRKRNFTECNHSATHLLHAALRQVLGTHVQQKGSLVREDMLRFDFSHFEKMSEEEIKQVEQIVNMRIRQNIKLEEARQIPIEEAKEAGAMMLFGEKYGDTVRMITFDKEFSRELCGGCHVDSTGEIGFFKILSETGIAAGVRRITAISSEYAEKHIAEQFELMDQISNILKNPQDLLSAVTELQEENKNLKKKIERLQSSKAGDIQKELAASAKDINGVKLIASAVSLGDSKAMKTLVYNLESELSNAVVLLGNSTDNKVQLMLKISDELVESKSYDAGAMIRELAKEVKGGGGGQKFFATAGGSDPSGLDNALNKIESLL